MTLHLDVSSLVRWTGPPVGIVRVERALAEAGPSLVVYDRGGGVFRGLSPRWAETVLGWHGALDVPEKGRSVLSRQRPFSALERVRLTRPPLAGLADRAQRALLSVRRHGHRLEGADGRRIAWVPADMALAGEVALGPGDTVLSAGSDWFHLEAAALGRLKRERGFRLASVCYDLIPITHPAFYAAEDVALVTRHWRAALPNLDVVVVNSAAIARDVRGFCAAEEIAVPRLAVRPLGADPPRGVAGPPPGPLRPGGYALFVSTIEPRKGHGTLLAAWRSLLAAGVPQRHDFRLVFAGRFGWMVDEVRAALAAGVERVHHFAGLDDAGLDALAGGMAFAVYPSAYEGFGLPVIEAFARGKPVLASTGGALPEVVAGAYPCLPPGEKGVWAEAMARWMAAPPAGPAVRPPTWREASAGILAAAG